MMLPNYKDAKIRNNNECKYIYDGYNIPLSLTNYGIDKYYCVLTYGCQMNIHDSENIRAILEDMKFQNTTDISKADIIVINTCAIRENAHNKVFGYLGRIKHLKEKKDIMTIFCGCMAQEEGVCNLIKDKYKWIDIIFGTHNIYKLPQYIEEYLQKQKQTINVLSYHGDVIENIPVKRDNKYKAWVNIMYGCDKFCTYCIVPLTRGGQRSRNHQDIIKEVEGLYQDGYKEVTLLGQNVNAYGKDINDDYDFANLLEDVANTKIDRIRFVTSHPWDFTDRMIDIISKYDNIMPYIHLPIQSGSSRILKLMGRRYTKEEYLTLVKKIKDKIPNVSITTDIIVGFPGEEDKDFKDTLDVVDDVKYDLAYTFIYSQREETAAAKLLDNTSFEEKKNRLHILNEKINHYALYNNKKYQDKVVKVLLEDYSDKDGKLMGYTDTMKLVNVKAPSSLLGFIVDVKIVDVKTWSLEGELLEKA